MGCLIKPQVEDPALCTSTWLWGGAGEKRETAAAGALRWEGVGIHLHVYLGARAYVYACAKVYVRRSEDNSVELVFSFYFCKVSRVEFRPLGFGDKGLLTLSHLTGLS